MILRHWHTGFVVKDIDQSVKFYVDGLGMKLIRKFHSKGAAAAKVVAYIASKASNVVTEVIKVLDNVSFVEISDISFIEIFEYFFTVLTDSEGWIFESIAAGNGTIGAFFCKYPPFRI